MRLSGRREIMGYMRIKNLRTLNKYRGLGLPVHVTPIAGLFALTDELDKWEIPGRKKAIRGVSKKITTGEASESAFQALAFARNAKTGQGARSG